MNLPIVDYTILYNQKDISRDISSYIINIQYTDKVTGESDSLEITVEDSDERWRNDWYPAKGDQLQLLIRKNGQQLNAGVFEIDELSAAGGTGGDTLVIKALAAGIKKALRTKNSYAHENKSLREIANTVAADMGLTLNGTLPDIRINRVTQLQETNLSFLNRIGADYGCVFSIRGNQLIFTYYENIEGRDPSLILKRQDLISFDLRDQSHKTFKQVNLKHHDPSTKSTVSYSSKSDDPDADTMSADSLELRVKADNAQQAAAKGKYALFKNNTQGAGGDVVLPGNLLFLAGNNYQQNGLGQLSGIYHILESTHTINRSGGYITSGNIKRVKTIDSSFFKT